MDSTRIEHAYLVPMNGSANVVEDGAVAIERGRIVAVGATAAVRTSHPDADAVLDATGMAVIPGLVNTHAHLIGGLNRGLTEDPPTGPGGFFGVAIPMHDQFVEPQDIYDASLAHGVESLLSGVTCVNETWWPQVPTIQVIRDLGLRAVVGSMVRETEFGQMSPTNVTRNWKPDLGRRTFADAVSIIEQWNGAEEGRITCSVAPLSPDTVSEPMLLACKELAEKWDLRLHVHLADNPGQTLYTKEARGLTPTAYLASLGYLSDRFVGAHSVFLDPDDVGMLSESGAHISHTAFLVGKRAYFPPMPSIYAAGVAVSLGTDWGSADLFKTMRSAIVLARYQAGRPDVVDAAAILEFATIGGARALGLDGEIGSLEVGKKADITVVDMRTPWCSPIRTDNVVTNLVFNANASDVTDVFIDGEAVVRDKKLMRLEQGELLRRSQLAANRVWSRAEDLLSAFAGSSQLRG